MIYMMTFIISVVLQAIVVFFVLWLCHVIFWTVVNIIRLFLYYRCNCDTFTLEEKIELKITTLNETEQIVEVLDSEDKTHDEYWEEINERYDIEFEQSQLNSDELIFKGKIKRRR